MGSKDSRQKGTLSKGSISLKKHYTQNPKKRLSLPAFKWERSGYNEPRKEQQSYSELTQ